MDKCLELSTFPSADPDAAFKPAAGKDHPTLIDAIWGEGHTRCLVDETTRRVLTVCAKSGLYQMLRMPFGPAPATAEMQGYVARQFQALRDSKQKEFCIALVDDLSLHSSTLSEHIEHLTILCKKARKSGFEFKFKKVQANQYEMEFWGSI